MKDPVGLILHICISKWITKKNETAFHSTFRGQSPAEADLNLLETARRCELYGTKLHTSKVRGRSAVEGKGHPEVLAPSELYDLRDLLLANSIYAAKNVIRPSSTPLTPARLLYGTTLRKGENNCFRLSEK